MPQQYQPCLSPAWDKQMGEVVTAVPCPRDPSPMDPCSLTSHSYVPPDRSPEVATLVFKNSERLMIQLLHQQAQGKAATKFLSLFQIRCKTVHVTAMETANVCLGCATASQDF